MILSYHYDTNMALLYHCDTHMALSVSDDISGTRDMGSLSTKPEFRDKKVEVGGGGGGGGGEEEAISSFEATKPRHAQTK